MPDWLQLTLKTVISIASISLLVLAWDNVRKHHDSIVKNHILLSLYVTIAATLVLGIINVWLDPTQHFGTFSLPFCDEISLAYLYLQCLMIQLMFLMMLESLLFIKNQHSIQNKNELIQIRARH